MTVQEIVKKVEEILTVETEIDPTHPLKAPYHYKCVCSVNGVRREISIEWLYASEGAYLVDVFPFEMEVGEDVDQTKLLHRTDAARWRFVVNWKENTIKHLWHDPAKEHYDGEGTLLAKGKEALQKLTWILRQSVIEVLYSWEGEGMHSAHGYLPIR